MATDKKRGSEVVGDMLRSLAVVIVIIVPLWLVIPHHQKQTVNRIDYSTELNEVRRTAAHHVVAPTGLPSTWQATSVSSSGGNGKPTVFHLGYVTPSGKYASVEQSDGPADAYLQTLLGKSPTGLNDVQVDGTAWRSLRGGDGRVALVSPSTPMTVVVKGTAGLPELTQLAASLQ